MSVTLTEHGAELHAGLALEVLPELEELFEAKQVSAGHRLSNLGPLKEPLSGRGIVGSIVGKHIGTTARPVRAIAFDKTPDTNWSLGWHQDRTICVRAKLDTPGYGPWTLKQGLHHVQPPFGLLRGMLTMRIHLDPVNPGSGPLKVALGSHRGGLVAEHEIAAVVDRCSEFSCLASPGDVWLYSTPILHASDRAELINHRRVLQVDYCAEELPGQLEWLL